MTYKRLKLALQQIVDGADDPVAIAKEALRSRIPPKQPPKPPDPNKGKIRREQRERAVMFFSSWVDEDFPPLLAFARERGLDRGKADRRISRAIRIPGKWRNKALSKLQAKYGDQYQDLADGDTADERRKRYVFKRLYWRKRIGGFNASDSD